MSYLIITLLITIVPLLCGLLPVTLMDGKQHTILGTYMTGWFTLFALFEVISVPFVLQKGSFTTMSKVFTIVLAVFLVLSVVLGRRVVNHAIRGVRDAWKNTGRWVKIGWSVVLLLLVAQMVFLMFHQYLDGDDAYYVTMANDTLHSDTMYRTLVYLGFPTDVVEVRHALAPVPLFMAWLSVLSGIHPTILAHSIMGPAFIGVMYGGYTMLGRRLFRQNPGWVWVFTLAVMASYVFGHVSLYTAETFAYTRTWQGKSMLPNLVLPALFLAVIDLYDQVGIGAWVRLWIVMIASFFTTSVAVIFTAVFVGVAGIILLIRTRNWKNLFGLGISMMLCATVGILYLWG